ncbi:RNA polymerase sigma-70 factor, ECF subfamily [Saccharicrinis carchari]|uniref:RNA polymerase sigma-70 factor, ECF subfamily n=1 Tax=Saccharicrinis carchari TaxID=1168039 RepID=A0A521CE33_SACCC|nr:RNA polymerase sigma-70 factor [Saccharicrinis carchari]SMO57635.1 RNA polymerase sigma-70 factor, ECF subfamily [Saccharicrinis carchari]
MEKRIDISDELLKRYCKGLCDKNELAWIEEEIKKTPHLKLRVDELNLEIAKEIEMTSFKEFFDFYYPKLMAHACRFIDDDSAKDVVQEVFVNYWEKRKTIQAKNIQAYLYRWVQNNCLNIIRHNNVAGDVLTRIATKRIEAFQLSSDNNESLQNLYTKDIYETIEASLEKLPPRTAEACRLFLFQDLAQKEISEQMDISVRTVETHIYKGFLFLRKDLSDIFFLLFLLYFNK